MLIPFLALITTSALGLLFGRFLDETYGVDIWYAVGPAAFPAIAALLLAVRPMNAKPWVWLTAAVWVNVGLAYPFMALLFLNDEPRSDGLAQMAAMALAAGSASVIAFVTGVRHQRRIGLYR